MIKKLTLVRPALFAALLCGISAASALAQDPPPAANPGSLNIPPPPPQGQRGPHGPPRGNPLFDALDANHDGTISADEIANASTSLKSLLKNGSDHLTRDDLRPAGGPPPPHAAPPPGDRPPADDQAEPPRPRVGAIRPHNPPPRGPEDVAPEPGAWHVHPPGPGEDRREDRREWRHSFQMHEEDTADAPPFPRRERLSRHQGPPHPEGDHMDRNERPQRHDEADHDARPAPHGPPPMPLFDALDANHDGTISADEIANASATLKSLLKNGSDHLTRDDLRPAGEPPRPGQ